MNINFHHVADLLGQELADQVLTDLGLGLGPATLSAMGELRRVTRGRDHVVAVGSTVGALLQSFLAERALAHPGSHLDAHGFLQPKFSTVDAAVLKDFESWVEAIRRPEPSRGAIDVQRIPERASIALFGDWGTGTAGAENVARGIETSRCSIRVHLGDVYYSGTVAETQGYLIDRWPGGGFGLDRACNSNHEMYSGGAGYYGLTLPFLGQSGSEFALANQDWVLVGLDTGTTDGRLGQEQAHRFVELVASLPGHLILLSHHPLFSWTSGPNEDLREDVALLLGTGRVRAWYSAHDHGFVRFDPDDAGVRVTCVGNSGFPYERVPTTGRVHEESGEYRLEELAQLRGNPAAEGVLGPSGFRPSGDEYGPLGWLRVELDGPVVRETVIMEDGSAHFARQWTSERRPG